MADTTFALKAGEYIKNRYVIKKVIGRGGFGFTYEAYDEANGSRCAVKEYYPRDIALRLPDGKTLYQMADSVEEVYNHGKKRFLEEAQVLWKLQDVQSVVSVYDYFEENNTCYFAMEFIDGVDLKKLIKSTGKLDFEYVRAIFFDVGTGLIQVHNMGVFHRDIKPDNIMITTTGKAKLIDFGNAKSIKSDNDEEYSVMLTPKFAPPEQYKKKSAQGPWTDVYAFASTMFYAMTGNMVPDPMERYTSGERINLEQIGFPDYVSDAINGALKLNYKERTQTIYELLLELKWFSDGGNTRTRITDDDPNVVINDNDPLPKVEPPIKSIHGRVPHPYAVIVSGDNKGSTVRLPVNRAVIVGRTRNYAQIIFEQDEFISKKHCEIYYDSIEDALYVTDYSTNGTWVNGYRLNRNQVYSVEKGSVIVLANQKCSFKVGVMYQ